MSDDAAPPAARDPVQHLASLTPARIGLGRSGISIPTRASLAFNAAHAAARTAVHHALDVATMTAVLAPLHIPVLTVRSRAPDRTTYLQRPDFGRRLDEASSRRLAEIAAVPADLAIVVADGLSALAVERNAPTLVRLLIEHARDAGYSLAPLVIASEARVALGDEIGERLRARIVVVLIGERPGLSSPDSLGVYLTLGPRVGRTDAERNCISNVRDGGLDAETAERKLAYLIAEALRLGLSGVDLKDRSDEHAGIVVPRRRNFLIEPEA